MLTLPPRVTTKFNDEATALVGAFQRVEAAPPPKPEEWSIDQRVPVATIRIDEGFARSAPLTLPDAAERLQRIRVPVDGGWMVLDANDSARVESLARWVATRPEVRAVVTHRPILGHLLRWLESRLKGQGEPEWLSSVLPFIDGSTTNQTVLVPLEGIEINAPFRLGRASFSVITRQQATAMRERMLKEAPESITDDERSQIEAFASKHAGLVVGAVEIRAVPEAARELALPVVDEALDLLRFLMPDCSDPESRLNFGRRGQLSRRRDSTLVMVDGVPAHPSEGVDRGVPAFVNTRSSSDDPVGAKLTDIATNSERTQLEETLLAAVRLYARGVLLPEPEDRLVHALVALETLLLKKHSESIKAALRRRCAAAMRDLKPTSEVEAAIDAAYKLRSNFLHHGRRLNPSEIAAVRAGIEVSRAVLLRTLEVQPEIRTRAQYCRLLDRLAGQPDADDSADE